MGIQLTKVIALVGGLTFMAASATQPDGSIANLQTLALGYLSLIRNYPHTELVNESSGLVQDHEVGLGAIKKVRGTWRFRDSERLTGTLSRYTWQVVDGFSASEVMDELLDAMSPEIQLTALFECDGRSCGRSVQWANRVFNNRVLYGREDLQRYRVFSLGAGGKDRLMLYSAARTADRQYLHAELLVTDTPQNPETP
ncbi:MAG: DUF4892 domain-containing protein [Pseudomonadota bacterium]